MKWYMDYNKSTGALAFYSDELCPYISNGYIEITEEQHELYCSTVGYKMNLETMAIEFAMPPAKEKKLSEIDILRQQLEDTQGELQAQNAEIILALVQNDLM